MIPTHPMPVAKRDVALDGLRGLAALAVFWNHVGADPVGGHTAPVWTVWAFDGSGAVLVFFILSGYVIGFTTPRSAERKDVGLYARRRLVRLAPINLIGVVLGCAVAVGVALWVAIANVFFLENYTSYVWFSVPVVPGNENLWSLNYEALYYSLFVLIWLLRPSLKSLALGCLAAALLGWYTSLLPLFVACYAAGFLFWIAGLGLAWHAEPAEEERSNWPSCALILIVTWKLRTLLNLLTVFPVPLFDGPVARLYNLDALPASIWLLSLVARRRVPRLAWIKGLCAAIPLVGLAIKWNRPGYFTPSDYHWAVGSYLIALALWRWRPSLRFFRVFAPVGSIAYALYAVSRPVQEFVFGHDLWLPQNAVGYAACALLTTVISLSLAWLLERRLQPLLTRAFLKRPAQAPS